MLSLSVMKETIDRFCSYFKISKEFVDFMKWECEAIDRMDEDLFCDYVANRVSDFTDENEKKLFLRVKILLRSLKASFACLLPLIIVGGYLS